MQKTVYFHIGTPKTGTSTIQRFFFENRDIMRSQHDINYPLIDDHSFRQITNGKFIHKPELYTTFFQALADSKCSRILFSEEMIFLQDHLDFFKHVELKKYDVKVIVYIRNAADYLTSLWGEMYKIRNMNPDMFEIEQYLLSNPYENDLLRLFELGKIVDNNNIILKPYEKDIFKETPLIEDFLSIFFINNSSDFKTIENENNSLSRNQCEVVKMLKRYRKSLKYLPKEVDLLCAKVTVDKLKIIESVNDELIQIVCDKYKIIEQNLSKTFCNTDNIFTSAYPSCFKRKRPKYKGLSIMDLFKVNCFLLKMFLQQHNIKSLISLLYKNLIRKQFP
jgi:hypothetical protein